MSTGWPTGRNALGQALVPGAESPGGALAVNEQLARFTLDRVRFDLAGIVRDIKQKAQIAIGKKMSENAPRVMAEDFAVGKRAIDRRPHRAEVALADFRVDRRAGELSVNKLDAR